MRKMALLLLALLAMATAATAGTVTLKLDRVTQRTARGENPLRVDSRATFAFDPEAGTLQASGTFYAQSVVGGPQQLTRFTHQVEDLRVAADGTLTVKSYQCIEGTFGAMLAANLCGNYRFGPNFRDDGGYGDDVVVGPPRSLAPFRVTGRAWDGQELVLTLSADGLTDGSVFPEDGLTLSLTPVESKKSGLKPR
jgi:hypothetical protein